MNFLRIMQSVLLAFSLMLSASSISALAQELRFIDVPGATSTQALGIDPQGDVVGTYADSFGSFGQHGFLLHKGAFTAIDVPGSLATTAETVSRAGHV